MNRNSKNGSMIAKKRSCTALEHLRWHEVSMKVLTGMLAG